MGEKKEEITKDMAMQDLREMDLITLLKRSWRREDLNEEMSRKLEEIEHRVERGEYISNEDLEMFFNAVTESSVHNARFDILREKLEAYNKEQEEIVNRREKESAQREKIDTQIAFLREQMANAGAFANDLEGMKKIEEQIKILQKQRDALGEPEEIKPMSERTEEEEQQGHDAVEDYYNTLDKEIKEYEGKDKFGKDDLKGTVSDLKESEYKKGWKSIEKDRDRDKDKDIDSYRED